MEDDELGVLLDQLMAEGIVNHAFRLQLLVTLAQREAKPESFVETFVSQIHERIDANEIAVGPNIYPQVHETARGYADNLGLSALKIVSILQHRPPEA